jgi:hypothetical protein
MKGSIMSDERIQMDELLLISQVAHVVERSGLAMSGAMCGTFVAALQSTANAELFDSTGFILSMVLIGSIGFYLGIDIPRLARPFRRRGLDLVEVLSATGTFLAAMAALISVYDFVFDDIPQRIWEFTLGSWWMLGVGMQISAGLIGRVRFARSSA